MIPTVRMPDSYYEKFAVYYCEKCQKRLSKKSADGLCYKCRVEGGQK